MRPLTYRNDNTLKFADETSDPPPEYAILSHTWGSDEDEVTYEDILQDSGRGKAGYEKIRFCGDQALKDGLQQFWVDTCCINKSNHVELSEAIISMFRWYQHSTACYVYLADVSYRPEEDAGAEDTLRRSWKPAFRRSRWFTRGWTLQELVAPENVIFFSKEGTRLGSKESLRELISEITGIPVGALSGQSLSKFTIPERIGWTRGRSTKKIEDSAYCLLGIFNVYMPYLYGEKDNAYRRLADEIRKIDAHADLTGLPGSSRQIQSDSSTSASISNSAQERRKLLLAELAFEQMGSRQANIKSAYSTTCKWVFTHPTYLEWKDSEQLRKHNGFLWIHGHPGAGKSTLMKVLHAQAKTSKESDEVVLAFFFNARGDALEKSVTGMYRALLHELLTNFEDIQVTDGPLSASDMQIDLTPEALQDLLRAVFTKLGHKRVNCFVDALDECDEDEVREMVLFFETVGEGAVEASREFRVCFASRHYPTIDTQNGLKLILDHETGHTEDLTKYVQSHLRAGKGEYIKEIRAEVLRKANGVFMWVVLVVDILNKEFKKGRIFAVRKRLDDIPGKLSELFKDILRRDQTDLADLLLCLQWILFAKRPLKREEFYFAMAVGLDVESAGPYEWRSEEVSTEDMARYVLNSSKGMAELTRSKVPTVQFIHESIKDFLVKDNGLSELWTEYAEDLFGPSHDRLKDCCQKYLSNFIATKPGSPLVFGYGNLLPKASSPEAKTLRENVTTAWPFLDYATQFVLHHANEAAPKISQADFLSSFPLVDWIHLKNLLERFEIRRYTSSASLAYIFSDNGFSNLLELLRKQDVPLFARGERHQYPILAALVNGHTDVVSVLSRGKFAYNPDKVTHCSGSLALALPRRGQKLASWAISTRREDLVELFIMIWLNEVSSDACASLGLPGPVDTNRDCRRSIDPYFVLELVKQGWTRLISLVLGVFSHDEITQITHKDAGPCRWVTTAFEKADEAMIDLLLGKGIDINIRDCDGQTPLHNAVKRKPHYDVERKLFNAIEGLLRRGAVKGLLRRGADPGVRDHKQSTSVLEAILIQDLETARALLTHDVGTVVESHRTTKPLCHLIFESPLLSYRHPYFSSGCHALDNHQVRLMLLEEQSRRHHLMNTSSELFKRGLAAIIDGHPELLALVLKDPGELDDVNDDTKRLFLWAASQSLSNLLSLPYLQSFDIDTTDKFGRSALLLASEFGDIENVRFLLNKGADIEARDENGRTALLIASQLGKIDVVRLLVERDANIEARDNFGRTALLLAVEEPGDQTMEFLVGCGVDVNARDEYGCTALGLSITCRSEFIISLLIQHGADLEQKNSKGQTPLALAMKIGSGSTVRLLLDSGANSHAVDDSGRTLADEVLRYREQETSVCDDGVVRVTYKIT